MSDLCRFTFLPHSPIYVRFMKIYVQKPPQAYHVAGLGRLVSERFAFRGTASSEEPRDTHTRGSANGRGQCRQQRDDCIDQRFPCFLAHNYQLSTINYKLLRPFFFLQRISRIARRPCGLGVTVRILSVDRRISRIDCAGNIRTIRNDRDTFVTSSFA